MFNYYNKLLKIIKITFLLFILALTSAVQAANDVNQYINELVNKAQLILSDADLSKEERKNKSKILISVNLEVDWMAKYTLGRYRKSLTEDEIKKFSNTYSKYVINTFSQLILNYKGEKTKIKNIEKLDEKEFVVKTEVLKNNGQPPIKVDYMVRNLQNSNGNNFKIFDIITEGISMINSQKSEFVGVLTNNNLNELISSLENKL